MTRKKEVLLMPRVRPPKKMIKRQPRKRKERKKRW